MIAYLDTQVVLWLCGNHVEKLTKDAKDAIEGSDLLISPIVVLELQYLFAIECLQQPPQILLQQLQSQIGLTVCDHPFPSIINAALYETWTRDPFDRIIAAHARSNALSLLITSDEKIRANYPRCVW